MTNDEIADFLNLTAKLMELHNENPFKIRALTTAAFRIEKMQQEISELSDAEIEKVEGIGKGIAGKISELLKKGSTAEFEELNNNTPQGVTEMLHIKGLGAKKVSSLWKELGISNLGELEYACMENRLVQLKGFGAKTQDAILKNLHFLKKQKGWYHFAQIENLALEFLDELRSRHPETHIEPCGAIVRKMEIVSKLEFVVSQDFPLSHYKNAGVENIPVEFYPADESHFGHVIFEKNCSDDFHTSFIKSYGRPDKIQKEADYFIQAGLDYIPAECRESEPLNKIIEATANLIEEKDLKGIIHNHSTWSDGAASVEEMALEAKKRGFEYLVMSDHSKSAFYASGLSEESAEAQWKEIDNLNKKLYPFKIYKGIESDILNDGSLDYSDEFIKGFDIVIASVHSNLRMNEEKATARLIRAIEHPATRILGHMTGRLLLTREGYPLDTKKIIDACAANHVVIELNAHPFRLDIDWRLIPKAIEKGVMISINPDAHATEGYDDMRYGINVARKGLLQKNNCLNTKNIQEFEKWLIK
jgi:DNA polymerase (family 10)